VAKYVLKEIKFMVKKYLIIGDIHGRDDWKDDVLKALDDGIEIIFLGDYVDSFNIKPKKIVSNLEEIIKIKKKNIKLVTLLLGNHDYGYIHKHTTLSGYNAGWSSDYNELFSKNWDLFDAAWGKFDEYGKYTLITHAGLTKNFWDEFIIPTLDDPTTNVYKIIGDEWDELPMHVILNYFKDDAYVLWNVGPGREGFSIGSFIWAAKSELLNDRYKNINQIVGHSPGIAVEKYKVDDDMIYFVDGKGHTEKLIVVI